VPTSRLQYVLQICIAIDTVLSNNDTELKPRTKKVDFLTKKIETTTPIPIDQAWSRAYKKVGACVSIAPYAEKSDARGAKKGPFCMGILVTLSLSKKRHL